MKPIRKFFSMALVALSLTTANAQVTPSKAATEVSDTDVYQCPMKCEGDKVYNKAGKCAVCGMNLKAKQIAAVSIYQCPMKCEGDKTYDKAGKCTVCGMNLKAKVVASVYQCPMKCEGGKTYDKPGKCPVCNMNLKKVEVKKEVDEHKGHNHK